MGEWWIFLCNLSESPVCLHGHCKKWTWVLWSSTVFKLFILQCSYQKPGPKKYPDPNSKSNTCEASQLTRLLSGAHTWAIFVEVRVFFIACACRAGGRAGTLNQQTVAKSKRSASCHTCSIPVLFPSARTIPFLCTQVLSSKPMSSNPENHTPEPRTAEL